MPVHTLRLFLGGTLLLLTACLEDPPAKDDSNGGSPPDDTAGSETDPTRDDTTEDATHHRPDCRYTASSFPTDGAADAYYRGELYFRLSGPDPDATISTSIPGTQLVSDDALTISWIPSAPLEPSTSYTMTLDYCAGSAEVSFTTSALGEPLEASLEGNTYVLNLADANFVEPAGIGSVLGSLITVDLLLSVARVSGNELDVMGAIGSDAGGQDFCSPTSTYPTAEFSDAPYFSAGPQDLVLPLAGYEVQIDDFSISGTFAADGSYFGGGTLGGELDVRDLASILASMGYGVDEMCELVATLGATCKRCDDGELYCLRLEANQIVAEQTPESLVAVAGTNCEGCESGPPATGAVCE